MARELVDYVALALVRNKDEDAFLPTANDFSGDIEQVRDRAEELCGFRLSRECLHEAIRTLADCGLVRITDDDFSGTFVKVRASQLTNFFERASADVVKAEQDYGEASAVRTMPSDYPAASALLKHELFDDYHELGSTWLDRALDGLRGRIGPSGSIDDLIYNQRDIKPIEAPASDRIVTLDHNQQVQLESASSDLIEMIEKENSIDGDTDLRQRVLGQIKAGRELIRAQSLQAWLLYSTLMTVLSGLIEKYGGTAIGEAARQLLDLLIEHIFGK